MKPFLLGHDYADRPVEMTSAERSAHMHVIGASGSGKSKFLEQMIRQDLHNRQGFCIIDPHGSLYQAVLDYAGFRAIRHEIVLLDLSNPEFVIGFNPFRKAPKGDISVQVDSRVRAVMHAWGVENADQTPTLERTLRLIFTALLELNLSFQEAQYFIDFTAADVRGSFIEQLSSPLIRREWQELQELKAKDWRSEVLSAKNRLFRLLTSTALNRFFSTQGTTIDLAEIVEQGKVLLVNLARSDSFSQDNGRVFGSLLVNEFFEVALRRNASNPRLKPYYLYLDEFQKFVGLDIADMLDEVRKYKLFTVLAHQRFGQIDENLQDAVLTNCRTKAVFGGLQVEAAKMMALEMCIGQIDPMREKVSIYQTKFWPEYGRDKVYSRSTSSGRSIGTGQNQSTGLTTGSGLGTFFSPADWAFGSPELRGTSESTSLSQSRQSGEHSNETDFDGTAESESDVPILLPRPFQELSSIQYMPVEEQVLELTAAIKEQRSRQCFVKIHDQAARQITVPLVKSRVTLPSSLEWYRMKTLERGGAVPAGEVDRANEEIHRRWENKLAGSPPKTDGSPVPDFLGRE